MCTIVIEDLTPLDRTSCIKMYKDNARSRFFCRIAKRSIQIITGLDYSVTATGEWPSSLYSLRQVTEVKLGRVTSNSGWVTSEA